jgi:hypothetical protein
MWQVLIVNTMPIIKNPEPMSGSVGHVCCFTAATVAAAA